MGEDIKKIEIGIWWRKDFVSEEIKIGEERISAAEYIAFLKRTDLGSQYPKERFEERISKLVNNVFNSTLR